MKQNTLFIVTFLLSFNALSQQSISSWKDLSKHLSEPSICSIEENPDLCKCHTASDEQKANAFLLGKKVALEIQNLEASEKAAGRELKVVLIARSGTSLDKMQVYKDYDSNGNMISFRQFLDSVIYNGISDRASLLQNESADRTLKYSHVSIALKNDNKSEGEGEWQLHHLLYSCVDNGSSVFREGLGQFFLDDMKNYTAQLFVLPQQMQNRIEDLLLNKKMDYSFLTQHYNAAALFYDERQQNSNSWVLEILASAMAPENSVKSRADAIDYLEKTQYMGTKIHPKGFYSLMSFPGVSAFLPKTMCLKAQPAGPVHGLAEIVTVLSVEEYLRRQNALVSTQEVSIQSLQETNKGRETVKCDKTE